MDNRNQEHSKSGQPIYRYQQAPAPKIEQSLENPAQKDIDEHIRNNFGNVGKIFHEILPVRIHVDIHLAVPSESRDYYSIVTSGLSTLPMYTPPQYSQYKYSELFMCLPKDWNLAEEDFKNEDNYWPFRCLKYLARFPHDYKTWIWNMHTIPNQNPITSFSKNTKLCCSLLSMPFLFDEKAYKLRINKDKTIYFHSIIPIYKEEMEYKLKNGAEALIEKFKNNHLTELLDINRQSVVKKGLFGFS